MRLLLYRIAPLWALCFIVLAVSLSVARRDEALISGQIAFVSNRSTNYEVYTMRWDGRMVQRLTHTEAMELHPAWSPDGQTLVFAGDDWGERHLYQVDKAGGESPQALASDLWADHPLWSADGEQLLYQGLVLGVMDLFSLEAATRQNHNLTNSPRSAEFAPAWSPDSQAVIFVSDREGAYALYHMRLDESQAQRLTPSGLKATEPVWSPDGRWVAFVGGSDLYIIAPDGLHLRQLTHSPSQESAPDWSADSRYLAYSSDVSGQNELYRLNVRTGAAQRLTHAHGADRYPSWSPPLENPWAGQYYALEVGAAWGGLLGLRWLFRRYRN
jgi:TolB protein